MMNLKQVIGYLNHPKKDVRRLAETAADALRKVAAMEGQAKLLTHFEIEMVKLDERAAEIRRLKERIAAMELAGPECAIVLHRDGFVEVYGPGVSARIAHWPDLGPSRQRDAEAETRRQLPFAHRQLLEEKPKLTGHTKGCCSLASWKYLELAKEKLAGAWIQNALE